MCDYPLDLMVLCVCVCADSSAMFTEIHQCSRAFINVISYTCVISALSVPWGGQKSPGVWC